MVLSIGWAQRSENHFTAEYGTGYWLGIVGGSLMLVLLLYPVSKRVKLLNDLIPSRYWFGIHMVLGVVGPSLILFHSNFQLGSINSSVALICMLLVAASGLVGKYIYTHIHHGLFGSQITIKELQKENNDHHSELLRLYEKLYGKGEQLNKKLNSMEDKVLQPYTSLTKSLFHVIYLALNMYGFNRQVMRLVTEAAKIEKNNEDFDKEKIVSSINRYTLALQKLAAHRVYERLFSLWHILHLPLFYMMLVTAIVHIFAVHLY
jgi:ferritin-like protein